jgi:hypothetical protein
VLEALIECQKVRGGPVAFLTDIARTAGLSTDATRSVLAELITDRRLVQQIGAADATDQDSQYGLIDTD